MHCFAAALWLVFSNHLVSKDKTADAIALLQHAMGCQCRRFGGYYGLHVNGAAEIHRHALVNQQERRAIALFCIDTHMRDPGAGCHFPVNSSDIIAIDIFTQLFKTEATPTQLRRMASIQDGVGRLAREKRQTARAATKLAKTFGIDPDAWIMSDIA